MEVKKKVGVITMHRVINYGSFLQTYATQKIINDMGFCCEIIDYKFPNEWQYNNGLPDLRNIKTVIHDRIYPLGLLKSHRKRKSIENAINDYLDLSVEYNSPEEILNNPPEYDTYITGSDQTWNVKHTRGDNTFLLAFSPPKSKKISFSASMADNSLSDIYISDFKKYLKEYSKISIRDSNANKVIKELTGNFAEVTLDPTLALSFKEWSDFSKNKKEIYKGKKYIIFYLITHSFDPRPYIYELLLKLQKETGLEVYSFTDIPGNQGIKYKNCSDISVEHFLQLFENASYVVTSSFHGTAFAANFGIPMYSVVNDLGCADDRQSSLLSKLNIKNCLVKVGDKFDKINPKYNIKDEQKELEKLRNITKEYLKKNI
ncbi:hypothetical protein GLP24_06365 [Photobacterium carnosum]|uniref:polysaccharide pyruvyl transferase family protein n=1 Tax=Photobacterium carnosum TaxID=2023717 RepID=UPI001E631B04|nr:polysaccharide pyruvyl transferase family protein [Photobacterium carnosum]MCD9544469.1 hypothetical protein [Photobacterium carnosum]